MSSHQLKSLSNEKKLEAKLASRDREVMQMRLENDEVKSCNSWLKEKHVELVFELGKLVAENQQLKALLDKGVHVADERFDTLMERDCENDGTEEGGAYYEYKRIDSAIAKNRWDTTDAMLRIGRSNRDDGYGEFTGDVPFARYQLDSDRKSPTHEEFAGAGSVKPGSSTLDEYETGQSVEANLGEMIEDPWNADLNLGYADDSYGGSTQSYVLSHLKLSPVVSANKNARSRGYAQRINRHIPRLPLQQEQNKSRLIEVANAHKSKRVRGRIALGPQANHKVKSSFGSRAAVGHNVLLAPGKTGSFECYICKKRFVQEAELANHMKIVCFRRFGCTVCRKRFTLKHDLQRHSLVHTGERPFACNYEQCVKTFNRSSALNRHKRSHTGDPPFECNYPGCEKRFGQKSNLNRHERIHSRDNPSEGEHPAWGQYFGCKDQLVSLSTNSC